MGTLREVPDPEHERSRDEDDPQGMDLWIMPYIADSTLRPVLIVVMAHVVAFVAPVILMAVRDRNPGGIIGLVFLLFLTQRGCRYEKRERGFHGAISYILLGIWGAASVAAWFADTKGLF